MIRSLNRQRFRGASVFRGSAWLGLWPLSCALTWSRPAFSSDADGSQPSTAQGSVDPWWGRDKALHLGVSSGLAAGGYGLSSLWLDRAWQRASAGAAFALTVGAGKELIDWAGYGDASYKDMLYNLAGTALGVTLAYLVDLATGSSEATHGAQAQGLGQARPLLVF